LNVFEGLIWHQSRPRRFGEETNFLPLPGIEPRRFGRPTRTSLSLFRRHYAVSLIIFAI